MHSTQQFNSILPGSYFEDLRHIYSTDSNEFPIIDICRHAFTAFLAVAWLRKVAGNRRLSCYDLGRGCCPQLIYNHFDWIQFNIL